MGTFHNNLGQLHGVTVVVDCADGTTCVGRCHQANDKQVILLDVGTHRAHEDGLTRDAYLRQAARWGVFSKHEHLILPRREVISITPLGEWSVD
ncbi:MAG: hypothetical protein GVY24_01505 [Planctomycetes bacterium]|nr:hypothetical protein [Planctomycetota bacterium]